MALVAWTGKASQAEDVGGVPGVTEQPQKYQASRSALASWSDMLGYVTSLRDLDPRHCQEDRCHPFWSDHKIGKVYGGGSIT
jgi:hypothetical protein